MVKIAQIIVAAGSGTRSGTAIPKQYHQICGKPMIYRTLSACLIEPRITETIIVVAKDDPFIDEILCDFKQAVVKVTGGATRTQSVRAGLDALETTAPDYVLIHDGARPFVSPSIISSVIENLAHYQSVVPALPMTDSLKSISGDNIDREQVKRVQTPQGFHFAEILDAFKALDPGDSFTDDIAIAKNAGLTLAMIDGEDRNFKVTFPDDFTKAEALLETSYYLSTGTGFDVHRFTTGNTLWLCGVEIDCGYSLLGHSDADVGLHALTDAILGGMAFGDIGDHFPPSDPQWKGASSDKFLSFAVKTLTERGGTINNVDLTLICEKPKIKPHRDAMRARIAELLGIKISRVSVKATTTEGLGFTGRAEGIAAQASVSLKLRDD